MRILYLANNRLGLEVLRWLKNRGENIVGLVLHPPQKQKYAKEIKQIAKLASRLVLDGSKLHTSRSQNTLREMNADVAISVLFDYILKPDFLALFPKGVLNLHPALLPYNRGQYPNVWSIVENTPAGTTLHYIDAGIDTGAILAQKKVLMEPVDTGKTLYQKLEKASLDLFKESWPRFIRGKLKAKTQKNKKGTYHRTLDVNKIDLIDLNKKYKAGDLINILRARTFEPYPGAYFISKGKRVYLSLALNYDPKGRRS
ncbi:MAG TPA: formyltransferase family protein [Candidatus Omnitrophota bacterium]|nr:formyltransferase family protein [Candidatus Omnitrophota bacterium]